MRIGIDYRLLSIGAAVLNRGMGRYIQQQIRAVVKLDTAHTYVLVCDPHTDVNHIPPDIRDTPNVSVVAASVDSRRVHTAKQATRYSQAFQAWLAGQRLDVFHLTLPLILGLPVLEQFEICPLVATLYDLIPYLFPDEYLREDRFRETDYGRALAVTQQADALIAISESARQDALRYLGFSASEVTVAYPYADALFRPLTADELATQWVPLRHRLRLPEHFILSVTDIGHNKNIGLLLAAYARLPDTLRQHYPLVIGGAFKPSKQALLDELLSRFGLRDAVTVLGHVTDEDLVTVYNAAALLIHPSRYEGFGLPVLEAMQCGTPVIAANTSSLPEVAGDAAVLIDPDDPLPLSDAIQRLIELPDERAFMRTRGLQQAARFTAEQLGRHTLNSYHQAAARRGLQHPTREIARSTVVDNRFSPSDYRGLELHATMTSVLARWDQVRRPDADQRLDAIPVLGGLARLARRVKVLGLSWDVQRRFYQAVVNTLSWLGERVATLEQRTQGEVVWTANDSGRGLFSPPGTPHATATAQADVEFLQQTLKPGSVFVDIGAGVGALSMVAAACVGIHGRVICVEPEPANHAALHLNVASLPTAACVSIVRAEPAPFTLWGATRRLRIDDLLAHQTRVDLLRLEARCCTRATLDGLTRTLTTFAPPVMLDGSLTAAQVDQVVGWLRPYGYRRVQLPDGARSVIVLAREPAEN